MAKTPLPEGIFQVDELLAQFIQFPVRLGLAIDLQPCRLHRGVLAGRQGPVPLDAGRIDGKAAPRHQANRFVIQRRRAQGFFHQRQVLRLVRMRAQHGRVLVAEDELDLAVLEGLEAR
ncbi:hypothetical protein CS8_058740 [Cupriavidus sp. 8B]